MEYPPLLSPPDHVARARTVQEHTTGRDWQGA